MSERASTGGRPITVSADVWTAHYPSVRQTLAVDPLFDAERLDTLMTSHGHLLGDLRIFPKGALEIAIPPLTPAERTTGSADDGEGELHVFTLAPETASRLAETFSGLTPYSQTVPPARPDPTPSPCPPAFSRPEVPKALGHYEIRRPLGAGGMGIVYQAFDTRQGRDVAVKVLPGALYAGGQQIERLLREARIGAGLSHAGICQVLDAGQEGGEFYFVMEYVEGQPLSALIDRGPLPVSQACGYAAQLLDALRYLAERNVVHRDIKPANLMVCAGERLKLLDLGLAKDLDRVASRLTAEGAVLGTPAYMAPEQAEGRVDRITPRTDLYATGATLFEMLTGEVPFTGPPVSVLYNVIHSPAPDPREKRPGLPPALADLVVRLLAKDPAARAGHDEALRAPASFRDTAAAPVPVLPRSAAPAQSVVARINEAAQQFHDPDRDDLLERLPADGGKARLGNYFLEERIGARAVINTYRARHSLTGLPAIVRLLPPAFSQMAPERLQALLQQQARLVQIGVSCPQLSRLVDVGRAELTQGNYKAVYYTVEDFLPGTTLEQLVRAGERLQPPDASCCLSDALRGLRALHDQGLLHGNLHAGKLFLASPDTGLRICDLSLSCAVPAGPGKAPAAADVLNQADWVSNRSPGRRQYIAPEVLCDGQSAGPRAEQFALGVIFVEGLTGRPLRTDPNDLKLLNYVRADLEDRLLEIGNGSGRLARVLGRMVASNAASRYADVGAVLEALGQRPAAPGRREGRGRRAAADKERPLPHGSGFEVFISYRRETGSETARAIVERLSKKNVRTFLDVDALMSGRFDEKLLTTIETTPHFVVILSPDSLDRCQDPGDWLRREVSHALGTPGVNVVPVLMPRFRMPDAGALPEELRTLPRWNAISYTHLQFDGFIEQLMKFLNRPDGEDPLRRHRYGGKA